MRLSARLHGQALRKHLLSLQSQPMRKWCPLSRNRQLQLPMLLSNRYVQFTNIHIIFPDTSVSWSYLLDIFWLAWALELLASLLPADRVSVLGSGCIGWHMQSRCLLPIRKKFYGEAWGVGATLDWNLGLNIFITKECNFDHQTRLFFNFYPSLFKQVFKLANKHCQVL